MPRPKRPKVPKVPAPPFEAFALRMWLICRGKFNRRGRPRRCRECGVRNGQAFTAIVDARFPQGRADVLADRLCQCCAAPLVVLAENTNHDLVPSCGRGEE
jgi:hypothetical protein